MLRKTERKKATFVLPTQLVAIAVHITQHTSKQHTTHKAQRTVHSAQHTVHSKQYECYLFSLFLPVVSSVSHDIVVARVDRHVRRFIEGIGIGAQSRIE